MTLELGHTNYQTGSKTSVETVRKLEHSPSAPYPALTTEERIKFEEVANSGRQVVDWHFDSYPYASSNGCHA